MTRINYTGRRRITRDRIGLNLREAGDRLLLDVTKLDLSGLGLPPEASVIVEAYRQTGRKRVPCGTVGSLTLPVSAPLDEFSTAEGLLFRVKVVGVLADDGKLLAAAHRIAAEAGEAGGRKPLLPFKPSADLGQRLWRLDIDEEPVVLVNAELPDWKGYTQTPHFQALVFPEVVRLVALWVNDNREDAEEGGGALGDWRRFLAGIGKDPVTDPPEDDSEAEWAEEVAAAFCRRFKILDRLRAVIESEDDAT